MMAAALAKIPNQKAQCQLTVLLATLSLSFTSNYLIKLFFIPTPLYLTCLRFV
ncbi:hypothetical protein HMPREF9104_00043 [Lentilactobacillus kisonensis F0435]|uniref:Uncharacterized protein n=1 Tax=Lentilactobacillus kisonensis F0435 TaxID=797516 RepID=H1LBT3_9LACO|nr:hypothetical protein HMPREF9104_00043 [Lentilactobacillus kisonensis F0435]